MNKLTPFICLTLGLFFATSCDKETVLTTADIPSEIKTYTQNHFPEQKILQVIEEKDGFEKSFETTLEENYVLSFDRKINIQSLDGVNELPSSVIPEKILTYVQTNYPNNFITDWELERKTQQVRLNNDIDLVFDLDGNYKKIDN